MRIVPSIILVLIIFTGLRIFTDATTKHWTGTTTKLCANVTDQHAAAQRNFSAACGDVVLTMRSGATWAPEFRKLTSSEMQELYSDRPFQCEYAFEVVDTWYAAPVVTEQYRDCHQVQKRVLLRGRYT